MAVHDVDMNTVGSGALRLQNLLSQAGKIGSIFRANGARMLDHLLAHLEHRQQRDAQQQRAKPGQGARPQR